MEQAPSSNVRNHNLPLNDRQQLHKKRKGTNGYHHISQHETRQPQIFVQPPHNGYNPEHNFNQSPGGNFQLPPQANFPHLAFGSLGSSASNFSVPNLALGNAQVLNENMFSSFPPPSATLVSPHQLQNFSPLGVDIGSLPNLTQLASQGFINEPLQLGQGHQPFNRQAVLEQFKAQELQQQQLLKMAPVKKETLHLESPSSGPISPQIDRRQSHHDILRQHNEEYKMKQMKKAAVHQASTRFGSYAPQDSSHFNFILPSLPIYLVEGYEAKEEDVVIKEEVAQ